MLLNWSAPRITVRGGDAYAVRDAASVLLVVVVVRSDARGSFGAMQQHPFGATGGMYVYSRSGESDAELA
jgi:hypothetical protein